MQHEDIWQVRNQRLNEGGRLTFTAITLVSFNFLLLAVEVQAASERDPTDYLTLLLFKSQVARVVVDWRILVAVSAVPINHDLDLFE